MTAVERALEPGRPGPGAPAGRESAGVLARCAMTPAAARRARRGVRHRGQGPRTLTSPSLLAAVPDARVPARELVNRATSMSSPHRGRLDWGMNLLLAYAARTDAPVRRRQRAAGLLQQTIEHLRRRHRERCWCRSGNVTLVRAGDHAPADTQFLMPRARPAAVAGAGAAHAVVSNETCRPQRPTPCRTGCVLLAALAPGRFIGVLALLREASAEVSRNAMRTSPRSRAQGHRVIESITTPSAPV